MSTISGTFIWTDDLPDDQEVENAEEPVFATDFGTQWQYMATKPVIESLCNAMRLQESVTDLQMPSPEDHGWYTTFFIKGWICSLYVFWTGDSDHFNRFEFVVQLRHAWYHRLVHRSQYVDHFSALGAALARAMASAENIERVAFSSPAKW